MLDQTQRASFLERYLFYHSSHARHSGFYLKLLNILLLTDLLFEKFFLSYTKTNSASQHFITEGFTLVLQSDTTKFNAFSLVVLHFLEGSYYVFLKMPFLLIKYFSFYYSSFWTCWTLSYLPNYLFTVVIR